MQPIQREVPIVSAETEGNTVIIRALPLDKPTKVSDDGVTWYDEVWRSGAFDGLRPQKTVLQRNHAEAHGANIFGICRAITEDAGHVVTEFEIIEDAPLGKMGRELLRAGAWEGASVSAIMHRNGTRHTPTLVERTKVADFRHLAIVDRPAYAEARVLAVRHEPVDVRAYLDMLAEARNLAVKRPG